LELTMMKKLAALAVMASVFALAAPDTGDAARIKLRIKDRHDNDRISCNTARHMVRERGYAKVKIKSCVTPVYSFFGKKNGSLYVVRVDPQTRSVWRE
jgi:hypothetical protein